MRALVTGASGFIGGAVARALADRHLDVRVLLRDGATVNAPNASRFEVVRGDIRDATAVAAAARGCAAIFHVAGLYSFAAPRDELVTTNVEGMRNVLDVARANGARAVVTSSISTIGGVRDGVLPDERMVATHAPGPYKESKQRAEAVACEHAAGGTDVVIVNPTFPIGWGDVKPTPTGAMLRDFLAGRMPAYLDTGMNVVDVDDVAEGHWLAFDRGVRSERYILGNANLTMRELLAIFAGLAGRAVPRVRLPYRLALALALASRVVGSDRIPLEGVRTAREKRFADCTRAVRELGMPQTPIRDAAAKAIRWFQQRRP